MMPWNSESGCTLTSYPPHSSLHLCPPSSPHHLLNDGRAVGKKPSFFSCFCTLGEKLRSKNNSGFSGNSDIFPKLRSQNWKRWPQPQNLGQKYRYLSNFWENFQNSGVNFAKTQVIFGKTQVWKSKNLPQPQIENNQGPRKVSKKKPFSTVVTSKFWGP